MRKIKTLLMLAAVAGLVAVPGVGAAAEEPVETNNLDASSSVTDVDPDDDDGGGGGGGYSGGGSGAGCSMFTPFAQTLLAHC